MTQNATVVRMIGQDMAEVTTVRRSACAHNCAECAGCGSQPVSITVRVKCPFEVSPGDKVEIYSDNRVLGYAALVYLVPVALFLAGYFAAPFLSEPLRYICAGAGFALGIALAVLCDRAARRRNAVTYQIIRKL